LKSDHTEIKSSHDEVVGGIRTQNLRQRKGTPDEGNRTRSKEEKTDDEEKLESKFRQGRGRGRSELGRGSDRKGKKTGRVLARSGTY